MMKSIYEINREFMERQNEKPPSEYNIRRVYAPAAPVWKELLFFVLKIASIIAVGAVLFTFMFGFLRYQEPHMDPAIKDGDMVIFHRYTKTGYLPRDAIVFSVGGKQQVRRVVATAGDTVDITEQGLVINGALQQEPDIHQKTERYTDGVSFPLTVPENQVFVLGDSRDGAEDSRIYGCVKIENTMGKVMAVIRQRSI
jgi:signal peptidase I